jgi:4-alpha-glucanotransferase
MSVAASGTHDTEPLVVWWEQAPPLDRSQASALPTMHRVAQRSIADAPPEPVVREAILEALFASGSNLLLIPVQDVFGLRDRINDPSTMGGVNWTFKLPWLSDKLDENPAARAGLDRMQSWCEKHRRFPPSLAAQASYGETGKPI